MADKRLKDTDEILSSLGKRSGNRQTPTLPDSAQQAEEPKAEREALISSPLDDRPAARRRRRSRVSTVLQEEADPLDRNPLDMSKYQLPQRGPAEAGRPEEAAEPAAPAASAPVEEAPRPAPARSRTAAKKAPAPPPEGKRETAAQKAQREEEERAFSLDALDEEFEIQLELPPKPSLRKKGKGAAAPQPENPAPRESRGQQKAEPQRQPAPPEPVKEVLEYQFETLGPEQPEEEGDEGYFVLDSQEAEELLGRMDGDNEEPLLEMDRETEAFFQNFEQQVQQEEAVRSQSFQDTLAEKFNRERARYLKELGIPAEEDTPPQPEVPQRRILDLKIQPEMHMQPGEDAPPVTYGPGGDVRPLEGGEKEEPLPPRRKPAKVVDAASPAKQGGNGKKSSEELLLELAAQNQVRAIRGQAPKAAKKKNAAAARRMAATAGEAPAGRKPNTLRTVLLSTAAALVVVALIVVPLAYLLTRDRGMTENSLPEYVQGSGQTLTAYESYEFDTPHQVPDVMIKKSGITLRGLEVDTHVVISDTETRGAVTLRDMAVGGSIYVQNCAVDTLLLDNVTADRVIVGNASSRVTVQLAGSTAVNTVELRTPATVARQALEAGNDGTANILVKKSDEVDTLDVTLEGLALQSLVVNGGGVITLSAGSAVDSIAADGNLVLGGDGSVASLSASAATAGERLSLQLRGVPVANLSVKSPADLNLGTRVGNLATSDALAVSGGGEVDTLVLNSRFDSDRVSLEFSGATVHALISNAQSRVSVDGDARVNTLTANASVYTTGNKLNHLMVNADDVIYEIQPDKITVTPGVRPPESTADNPNLDLEASAAAAPDGGPLVDVSGDPVATTCAHTRESGGFVRGDGSRANPFEVATPAQLAHVSEHLTSHFRQTGDIDISDDSQFASGFPMIASGGSAFQGSYDGGGFFIANLRIASQAENVGLFAENVGEIRNVHVVSGEVQSTASTRTYAGGIVGLNYENGLVTSCSNGAKVVGSGSGYAGGLVGYNYKARVLDCYNYAKITGNGNVGGIVGVNRESASVAGSYNAGTIEANIDVGAVVGVNEGASVTNCYFLADTAEEGIGKGTGNVVEKTTQELSAAQMAMDLAGGNADSLWTMPSSGSYTYPVLDAPPTPAVEEAPASSAEGSGEESGGDVVEVG